MNKRYILAALIGLSAMACHMPSSATLSGKNLTEAERAEFMDPQRPKPPMRIPSRPSQFKAGLFFGTFFPILLIPSFRNNCLGQVKYDNDFSFLKGFGTGFATSAITLSAGSYALYKYFKNRN